MSPTALVRPPATGHPGAGSAERSRPRLPVTRWHTLPSARWALSALVFFLLGLVTTAVGAPQALTWALFGVCYAAGGWDPGLSGLRAMRERTLDVELLMVVAAIGAAAIGQVLDGALLIVIFATSGALEALATARTEDSVRGLLELAPQTAVRVGADGEERIPTVDLRIGDEILVRPGEWIGADGEVVSGFSDVDQASVTGESLPTDRGPGDRVFAGTLNGTGALRVRVNRLARDSVVARIAALVEEAGQAKGTTQLLVERIEQRYSIGMVAATTLLFAVPLLFGEPLQEALLRAMTFMIVASPCAIVLSSMPPLLAAVANAGRHGVLVKSAVAMERLADTDRIALDKTGTLTHGAPVLESVHPLTPGRTDAATTEDVRHRVSEGASTRSRTVPIDEADPVDHLVALAAAVEHASEHPLARAVVQSAAERRLQVPAARDFVARPGQGVSAVVDGHEVTLSSPAGTAHDVPVDLLDRVRSGGRTVVVLRVDGVPHALFVFSDRLRPDAATAVAAAAAVTGRAPVLLTGDNPAAAAQVAGLTGITTLRADLLPADKVAAIQEFEAAGERVAFVGDGVNDAPALAAAHSGIAMGAGADLSLQTADAVVVGEDLTAIPAVIGLSRRARRVVLANLAIAATCILALVTWDLLGDLPLPLGVAGHEGSTVVVGLNGLRLLRERAWTGGVPRS